MTENQKRAQDYLSRYGELKRKVEYSARTIEVLQARAEGLRSSLGFESGWTGEYVGKNTGKRWDGISGRYVDKRPNDPPMRVEVPLEGRGTRDPKQLEEVLAELADQLTKHEDLAYKLRVLRDEIEEMLDVLLPAEEADVMKRRYILGEKYTNISRYCFISETTVKARLNSGLETFGKRMTKLTDSD